MPKGIPKVPKTAQQVELQNRLKTCIKIVGLIETMDEKSLAEITTAIYNRREILANPITTGPAQYDGPANNAEA